MQGYPDKLLKNNALKIDTGGYPDKLMKKQEIRVYWRLRRAKLCVWSLFVHRIIVARCLLVATPLPLAPPVLI